MSLYPYVVFGSIVEHKSFTKAAEELGVTPSTVSHTISKLEDELGFPLFIRSRGSVQLTDSGRQLLPTIMNYLKLENKLDETCAEINGLERGTVRVGAFNSVTMAWLPDIIKKYHRQWPGIEIHIKQAGYREILTDIESGMLDIGFVTQDTAPGMEMTPLYRDPLLFVTPKSFRPKNGDYVTRDEIRTLPVAIQEGSEADTLRFLRELGMSTNTNVKISDDSSLIAVISAGISNAVMPSLLFNGTEDVATYPIDPPAYRVISLITVKNKFLSPAAEKMKDMILEYTDRLNG